MIVYAHATQKEFDAYGDLWIRANARVYPDAARHIAIVEPTKFQLSYLAATATEYTISTDKLLCRWRNLPVGVRYLNNTSILATSISTLPIKAYTFDNASDVHIVRRLRKELVVGLAAQLYTNSAARRLRNYSKSISDRDNTRINSWIHSELKTTECLAEYTLAQDRQTPHYAHWISADPKRTTTDNRQMLTSAID